MRSAFKMKGYSYPGTSPAKLTDEEKQANLLKAVPNKEAYDKLSDEDKKGFIEYAKKVGLPTKKSPAKQAKRSGFGPSTAFGGVKNPELIETKKPFSRKVMKDGYINPTQKAKLAKRKADYEKLSDAEKQKLQDEANAKSRAWRSSAEYKRRQSNAKKKK
tara:strand:+ start:216 stop:695 length:480 start_codon:yes stop_codon:yes gene_type:complete